MKARLRAEFRARRHALSPDERCGHAAAIVHRLRRLPQIERATTVHLFWPAASGNEVDLRPLAASLWRRGVQVALPAVASVRPPRLEHRAVTSEADLVPTRWGLREPSASAPAVSLDRLDVVVVPGVAFGRDGTRLGQGGGFYDAFLASCDAWRVGVTFETALADTVPTEPHDARMDVVVTERGTILVARPARNPAHAAP